MTTQSIPVEQAIQVRTTDDEYGSASCECCNDVKPMGKRKEFHLKKALVNLGVGFLIYLAALVLELPFGWGLSLFVISYLIIAWDVVWKAAKNLASGKLFDEFFLMTVATLGAFAIQEFPEAVGVMLFYKIGELFQGLALESSRQSISSLMEIRPDYANLQVNGETKKVDPELVEVGNILLIKPGERVPLDGVIVDGSSMMDTSALTGESMPRKVKKDDEILSGMINQGGLLITRVTKKFSESTVSKILDLVENASAKKAQTEKFITTLAKYYTPAVVFGAVAVAVVPVMLYKIPVFTPWFTHPATFSEWIYNALIFLVISCPCALVISIPLGFFGGIAAASKQGILVKGSNYLEALNALDTVVWDKTGTLTKGVFRVTEIKAYNGFAEDEILQSAAQVEWYSNHPIAQSIREAFPGIVDEQCIENYEEVAGHGVKAKVKGRDIWIGNDKFMPVTANLDNIDAKNGTIVHIAIDKLYAGYLVIADEIKQDAIAAIQALKRLGVKRQIMLTGDKRDVASSIAQKLGLDEFFAELLPHEKVKKMEELISNRTNTKSKIAFVGDGINDAPVLIRSDIGIAMGALGSDAAIEAADIVLMSDEPSRIVESIKIARRTRLIVWQNIFFALGVKGIFLAMGAFGLATMWEAVFADVGVALLAILNAMRVLKGNVSKMEAT